VAACGDADGSGAGGEADDGPTVTSGAGASGSGGATGATQAATSGTDAATTGAGGSGGGGSVGLTELGTLVVLGDSIGDGGGQSPFYYNLLRDRLTAKYGPIEYHREAQSGSKTGALVGQINDLPSQLPGPVAVAITSGGNDMKDALQLIITGNDLAARNQMGQNIDNALFNLLQPDRFGSGVTVHVFEANIYDASDGEGDFGSHDCAFGGGLPAIPTGTFFANWNGVIAEKVAARGQTLMDIHARFFGHGFDGNPSWYASDCTHPNALGHDQLADYFYEAITGEPSP
jgi:lysophospholipase L1-like esterase